MNLKTVSQLPTTAVENYLKAVYILEADHERVTTTSLAARLDVTAASASWMAKRLADDGLVDHARYHGVRLTRQGMAIALRVLRRHRLVEAYLHEVLGFSWDEVHEEAERLEHCVSERLEERLAVVLGDPLRDPHGDPIPPRRGGHSELPDVRLDHVPIGTRVRLERVSDRDPAILRYLARLGLLPSAEFILEEESPFGGPVWVTWAGNRHPLGPELARAMFVSVLAERRTTKVSA